MSQLLPFMVAGLVTGSLYGLAGTGLVLTYKTSGIFNFAHGALGAAAAYVFYDLRDHTGLPWPLALVVAVGILAPACGLALSLMAARLAQASTVRRVVATIGVLLIVQGFIQLRYGIVPIAFETSLPAGSVNVVGTVVGYDQLITVAVAIAALAGLAALFRTTRVGLEMRAVVDNDELLDLAGGAPKRVRALSWMIGSAFAGLSGVLFAPTVGLDSLLLTLLVVQAFGAAAVGRFKNLTATFVGGLGIGVVQFLLRSPTVVDNVPGLRSLGGLDQSVSFLALFGILLLTRSGTFSDAAFLRSPRTTTRMPRATRAVLAAATLVVVVVLPHAYPTKSGIFIQGAVFVTIFASFFLVVEVSGQVSLCHVTFVAVGATSFCHFTTGAGLPWFVGVILAGVAAIPIGALVAIPSIRLSGVFLALATLGFGIVVQQIAYTQGVMFGSIGQRVGVRPDVLGLDADAGYFYLCAGVAAAAIALVIVVRRTRLGRLLNALADAPVALLTHGSSTTVTRVLVFCLAAAMAAAGGALSVGVVGSVSATGVSPSALVPFNSLLWLAALAFAGRNPVTSPVIAAVALIVVPSYLTGPSLNQLLTIGFGAAALVIAVAGEPFARWIGEQGPGADARRALSPAAARLAPLRLEASGG
jgi:branched-subunit amino acid ABC-type transport system permease component